jgi:phosphoribosyl-ATP pyrophosphohydrolase
MNDILIELAKINPPEFNYNKAIEEAAEFVEALTKYQTKHPDNPKKPTKEDILKEYADFVYRGLAAVLTVYKDTGVSLDVLADMIEKHVEYKLAKLEQYKAEGKYKGGL